MRVATETLLMAREARLDAARVELMTGRAFGLRRVVAHQAFVHMRAVRVTMHVARDARETEFIVARRISEKLGLIVLRNAVLMARRAERAFLQGIVGGLLERFAAVALGAGVVKRQPGCGLSVRLTKFHVRRFGGVAAMTTRATLDWPIRFHQMLFARMIEIAFAFVSHDGGIIRIRRRFRGSRRWRRVGLGRKVAL